MKKTLTKKKQQKLFSKIIHLLQLKKLWVITFLILIATLWFWKNQQNGNEISKTSTVQRQTLTETISASGDIQTDDRATLRFPLGGKLVWLPVQKGDQVKKGQAIASLDQQDLEKRLTKALRDYSKERNDFEEDRQETYKDKVMDDTLARILEKNQWDLEKAVLDVEIADIVKRNAVLVAPIDGTVTTTSNMVAGTNILATDVIKVVDFSSLKFVANVDEVDYSKISLNQSVIIALDALSNETITGNVSYISREGSKTAGGGVIFPIDIEISSQNPKLAIGLSGDAEFVISEKTDTLVIPREFVKTEDGQ